MLLAVGASSWAIIVFVLLLIVGVSLYYSRRGSEITQHPMGSESDAPEAERPSRMSGMEDEPKGPLDTHGMK